MSVYRYHNLKASLSNLSVVVVFKNKRNGW